MAFDRAYFSPSIVWLWRVEILLNGNVIDTLTPAVRRDDGTVTGKGITGGQLSWNIYRDVRDQGSLDLRMPASAAKAMTWDRYHIRVSLDMVYPKTIQHTLCVAIPTVSNVTYTDGWAQCSLDLHGLTTYLQQTRPTATFSLFSGAITPQLVSLLSNATTYNKISVTSSDRAASANREWPVDTANHYLRIANDICASLGYFSMFTTPDGWIAAQPYTDPSSRQPVHTFNDDADNLYLRGWTVKNDTWSIPNRVIARQRANSDTVPLLSSYGDATGTPYSYDVRGGWVDADPIEVDAPDAGTLTAAAKAKLLDLQATNTTLDFAYGFLPILEHEAIQFANSKAGLSATWTIASRQMQINGPALVKATIRRVPTS